MRVLLPALLIASSLWSPAPLQAAPQPGAELLIIGTSPELYARYGHAAIRIGDEVYNYGYTDFASPQLVIDFVRARALFWGEREYYAATVDLYREGRRTLVRRRLNLSPAQLKHLRRLLQGVQERYVYHHFNENCSTRLRDILDSAVGGAIHRALEKRPPPLPKELEAPLTIRQLVRRGFADRVDLQLSIEIFLGRPADRPIDSWRAGFLPELLSAALDGVKVGGKNLLGPPQVVYQRPGPAPGQGDAGKDAVLLLWCVAAGLFALGLLAMPLARKGWRSSGLILLLLALLSISLALPLWIFVAISTVPELAHNEWVLLFWPTDIVLFAFATSLLRGRFWRRCWIDRYLAVRLVTLMLFAVAQLVGVLYQRPLAMLAIAATLLLAPWVVMRSLPPRGPEAKESEA